MNEEQNKPETDSEKTGVAGEAAVTPGNDPQLQDTLNGDNTVIQDDYYAVDHAKKDVVSTIGDGEMHDEGLAGTGEVTTDTDD